MLARIKRFWLNAGPLRATLFFAVIVAAFATFSYLAVRIDVLLGCLGIGIMLGGLLAPAICLNTVRRHFNILAKTQRVMWATLWIFAASFVLLNWTPPLPVSVSLFVLLSLYHGLQFWTISDPNAWSMRALSKLGLDPNSMTNTGADPDPSTDDPADTAGDDDGPAEPTQSKPPHAA